MFSTNSRTENTIDYILLSVVIIVISIAILGFVWVLT
jgi:hypothetical protein